MAPAMHAPEDAEAVRDALAGAIQAASARLSRALLDGRGIEEARAGLEEARRAFETHQAAINEAVARAEAERHAAVAAGTAAHIHVATDRLRAAAAAIALPPCIGDNLVTTTTAAIALEPAVEAALTAAAARLATAEYSLAEADAVAREARDEAGRIAGRIAELDTRRAEIGKRRAAGQQMPGDGGELEVIALDREHLAGLLGDEAAKSAAAQATAEQRRRIVEQARAAMAGIEAAARRDYFAQQAEALAEALLQTTTAMNEASKAAGDRKPAWRPQPGMIARIREYEFGVLR